MILIKIWINKLRYIFDSSEIIIVIKTSSNCLINSLIYSSFLENVEIITLKKKRIEISNMCSTLID